MAERDVSEQLDEHIHAEVAGGYTDVDQIAERVLEAFEGEEGVAAADVAARVARAVDAQLRAQQAWPARTDCEKLDEAFAALERVGVVARQNWTCCSTCGHSEIHDAIDEARAAGGAVDGYAFFHQQDTERAVAGGGLLIAFGVPYDKPDTDDDVVAVGKRIARALSEHGLAVEWEGTAAKRIGVTLEWRRRRRESRLPRPYAPAGESGAAAVDVVDAWCARFPEQNASALIEGTPLTLVVRALAAFHEHALAERWATGRAAPLAALSSSAPDAHERTRLALAAIDAVPRGASGTLALASLLLELPLDDAAVLTAARARADVACSAFYEALVDAWLAARAPAFDTERYRRALRLVTEGALDASPAYVARDAELALPAGLWLAHHRAGDVDGARQMRTETLERARRSIDGAHFALAAAAGAGDVDAVSELVVTKDALVDALLRAGRVESAVAVAASATHDQRVRCAAYLAMHGVDVERNLALAHELNDAALEELYCEGLVTALERDATALLRILAVAVAGSRADRERARAALAGHIATAAAPFDTVSERQLLQLSAPPPQPLPASSPLHASFDESAALSEWQAAKGVVAVRKAGRTVRKLLDRARSMRTAATEAIVRAVSAKLADADDADTARFVIGEKLAIAQLAVGMLDDAVALDDAYGASQATPLVIRALVDAGRVEDAERKLRAALASERGEARALLRPLLALAHARGTVDDAVERVSGALDDADARVAALRLVS